MRLLPPIARACSLLSLRFFDGKVSVFPICRCIMQNSTFFVAGSIDQGHELFHGKDINVVHLV